MSKNIILGVTGGITVYKAADLCSKLVSAGFDVRVIMTRNALQLISSQLFLTLSKNRVLTDLFAEYQPVPEHVSWAVWADALVVAPCTANFIGKFASGIADDALTTTAPSISANIPPHPTSSSRPSPTCSTAWWIGICSSGASMSRRTTS